MRIGINCGHTLSGSPGCGAVGYINESVETRRVGYLLMKKLRECGYEVVDCTDDSANSTLDNLKRITLKANAQPLDAFYSIHFNAGGGLGTEVYTYGGKDKVGASRIRNEIARLGFQNRGLKDGKNLYVLRHTNAPAALIEVCFVDMAADVSLYNKRGADKVAQAICNGITGAMPIGKGVPSMEQYDYIKSEISDLTETVKILTTELYNLKNPVVYNYIDDNMPEWARDSVQKAVNRGIIKGDGDGLKLTGSDLRHIVWNDRAGLYD